MFTGVDLGSGRITKSKAREIARKMFAEYDKDKSGVLEFSEIPEILKNIYKGIKKNYEPSEVNYFFHLSKISRATLNLSSKYLMKTVTDKLQLLIWSS